MIHIMLLCLVMSSNVVHEVAIDMDDLVVQRDGGYTKIRLPGYEPSDEIGAPEVPVRSIRLALPDEARVTDVTIIVQESQELEGEVILACVQPPVILSQTTVRTVEPNPKIYTSSVPYPSQVITFKGTQHVDGYSVAELLVYPVQYLPQLRKVRVYTRLRFVVHYEGGVVKNARFGMIRYMVANPEDVRFAERVNDGPQYVVITEAPLDTVFERLAQWKTKKGVKAVLRTVGWITGHYTGEDAAASVRNYLKTLADSGVVYVLLGGDTDVVPFRKTFAMRCEYGMHPREDSLPCDLYYADLDGSWDENNNGVYGEIADSINLYPELAVGRAPVNSVEGAQKFVEKVLGYERNPAPAYVDNALLAADILWSNPYTDQGIHKNRIEEESFPDNFEITKLYYSQGTLSPETFKDAIRQGNGLINHDGHGWIDVMGTGNGAISNIDFDTLTNAPFFGICISIGCWTTAFDFDAIAEHFVNSPNGGGIAFIGNSSYGWGSPGNPGFGYSDRFDSRFFYSLLQEKNFYLGTALSMAKAHFIPFSHEENVYRWHQYQLNLMGDPELCVWTALPDTLLVSAPQSISLGASSVLIAVRDKKTGSPVRNALVCLMKDAESYAVGKTDASGQVFLEATPSSIGDCDLTVTAHNYLPVETTLPVVDGAYVSYCGWQINDSLGNNDSIANPNENIIFDIAVKNTGNALATNVHATLRSSDSLVIISDSTESISNLAPGDSTIADNAFGLTIGDATNGYGISLELEIACATRTITYHPVLLVGTPLLHCEEVKITQPPTMPGETESLTVVLKNSGLGIGHATYATLASNDAYVTIVSDSVWYGEIRAESLSMGSQPFVVAIESGCPSSYLAQLPLTVYTADSRFNDTLELLVGETGFYDDIESGSGLWTTGGTGNLWHVSTRRCFSPTHAWYCGDSMTGHYNRNMNCYIQTVPFMVQANSLMRFYRWFDVPTYGTDGIYVIIMRNGYADTLDFIGTGGALGGRGIQSDWFEEAYSLTQCPAGETIQVRIAFISDNDFDVGEGFYIDDVRVKDITAITEHVDSSVCATSLEFYPNPSRSSIAMTMAFASQVVDNRLAVDIYDVTGRLVRSIEVTPLIQGNRCMCAWDGTDQLKRKVPTGVYFISLAGEKGKRYITKKAVLLR